ncbi:MAG: 2-amino-4-hydroxy-6-hydroxymethyldihydropteridine diphosphokinase [Pseudomonadota bacterium]|nr:2-amino-4-hydroxy-6-hydroxymethyldihydropteridine diphosphokinase [Pseudomonadota bacterium]
MILIGIGSNMVSPQYGAPRTTCGAALEALNEFGIIITDRSRWYKSAPVPISDQPWFINAVIKVKSKHSPEKLMELLLRIEKRFGRIRGEKNAPRILDLDIIAYNKLVLSINNSNLPALELPHPKLQDRAFVLKPLCDIAPEWRHPIKSLSPNEMIARLPQGQQTELLVDATGIYGTEWKS